MAFHDGKGILSRRTVCRRLTIDLFWLNLFACLRKGQWHSRYLSVTRVLLQTVGWTRSNISEHLRDAMGLRGDWISSCFVRPSRMRPLAWSQCRWVHHFNWNDCHLVKKLAIITSHACQKVVSRVLGHFTGGFFLSCTLIGPIMEYLFTKMHRHKKKHTMKRLLSYYMFQCILHSIIWGKLLKIEANYDLLAGNSESWYFEFDVKHSSQKVVSTATFRAMFETMKSCCVVGRP